MIDDRSIDDDDDNAENKNTRNHKRRTIGDDGVAGADCDIDDGASLSSTNMLRFCFFAAARFFLFLSSVYFNETHI